MSALVTLSEEGTNLHLLFVCDPILRDCSFLLRAFHFESIANFFRSDQCPTFLQRIVGPILQFLNLAVLPLVIPGLSVVRSW
jgi:hypothetical protein